MRAFCNTRSDFHKEKTYQNMWQPSFYAAFYFTFIIILYFHCFCSFISFFKLPLKNGLVNRAKALFRYFHLFCFVYLLLFHWVYFTSFFDHCVERNVCFYSFRSSHWEISNKIRLQRYKNWTCLQFKYSDHIRQRQLCFLLYGPDRP